MSCKKPIQGREGNPRLLSINITAAISFINARHPVMHPWIAEALVEGIFLVKSIWIESSNTYSPVHCLIAWLLATEKLGLSDPRSVSLPGNISAPCARIIHRVVSTTHISPSMPCMAQMLLDSQRLFEEMAYVVMVTMTMERRNGSGLPG